MTAPCGTCGRDCLPDGDCYGCEADRHLHLCAQAIRERDEWRAHAEALAARLEHAILWADKDTGKAHTALCATWDRNGGRECTCWLGQGRAALARFPAQALAERRALEQLVEACRDHLMSEDCGEGPTWDRAWALMTSWDAARGEGGA